VAHHFEKLLLLRSPVAYSKYKYKKYYGREIDLQNPSTFNEKLIWLNLFWRHPLKTICADKYTLRSYAQKQGFGHMLPDLLGVYNHSSEINFDALPQKFVLKCTHGSGFNIICLNKDELHQPSVRQQLDQWMKTDYSRKSCELHYKQMKPRIICEQFLDNNTGKPPTDYKVYCFSGKAHCIMLAHDRDINGKTDIYEFYDLDWRNKLYYYDKRTNAAVETDFPKPASHDEMIRAAEALSAPFPFVRMDFYDINGKAYLGEMTFTPSGCIYNDCTDLAQTVLGSLILLPLPIW
jgi:TupA-like ATPgrasp